MCCLVCRVVDWRATHIGEEWIVIKLTAPVHLDDVELWGAHIDEDIVEATPEGIESVVKRDNYTNAEPRPKSKYIFREAVLVNAGDILLVLGLFCTFGALIAPIIIDFGVDAPMIWATCGAVLIFAITMITWATLRTLAEISRMLRNRE